MMNSRLSAETGLVWGAILPHGPDVILEITKEPALMAETRAAMEEAGRRFAAARVDTVILLDPFLVHSQNKFATHTLFRGEGVLSIGMAAYATGSLGQSTERFACDEALARDILEAGRAVSFPIAGDAGQNGEQPLVWGATIPLWFLLRPLPQPRPQLVVIAPSPAVPRETLIRFGGLLAEVARSSGKRVALVASADHGHTHDPNHPRFGYSPAAAQYDAMYCEAVRANRLDRLRDVSDQMLVDSWSDSLWPTLILAGALNSAPMRADLLSYAVPSYYGMAVAVYDPVP
jgi:aromatic ring-opening dioxygenase LigB subunit